MPKICGKCSKRRTIYFLCDVCLDKIAGTDKIVYPIDFYEETLSSTLPQDIEMIFNY